MRFLLTLEAVLRMNPKRFLEVAANDGSLSACVAQNGTEAVCNDLRDSLLEDALSNYTTSEKVKVVGGNLFDLKKEDIGTFDLIAACEVIEHVAHPVKLLSHLKGLLAPGGRLLLTTPNGLHLRNKLPTFSEVKDFTALEASQFKPDADGHLFLFTSEELAGLARNLGFEIESIGVWGTPLLTGHCGLARLSRKGFTRLAYYTERITQHLPFRNRLCFSLFAILRTN
jgi:2-polyprenyl-3-methyl-5-hydroxy-6-metoxy-1,4-benzoquinol methylase